MLYLFVVRHCSSLRRAQAVLVLNFCSVTFLLNSWRVPMYSVSDGRPIVWLISQLCGIVPYLPSVLQSGPQSRRALPWTAPTNSSRLSLSIYLIENYEHSRGVLHSVFLVSIRKNAPSSLTIITNYIWLARISFINNYIFYPETFQFMIGLFHLNWLGTWRRY